MAARAGFTIRRRVPAALPLALPARAHLALLGSVLLPWLVVLAIPGLIVTTAKEDGPLEMAGAMLYLLAAAVFAAAAFSGPRRRLLSMLVPLSLAGVFFLAAGEEVSWGQRLFGWTTPEALAANNVQDETTLHNLSLFDCHVGCSGTFIHRDADGNLIVDLQRLFTLGVLGLLVIPPITAALSRRARSLATALAIPVASAFLATLAVVVFVLSRASLSVVSHEDAWAVRELMEAHWALLVAVLALTALARRRRSEA